MGNYKTASVNGAMLITINCAIINESISVSDVNSLFHFKHPSSKIEKKSKKPLNTKTERVIMKKVSVLKVLVLVAVSIHFSKDYYSQP